jgi:hypothetical protein
MSSGLNWADIKAYLILAEILTVVFALVVFITARYMHITVPSLIVRCLLSWAHWWLNAAVQCDVGLLQWRQHKKENASNPINERKMRKRMLQQIAPLHKRRVSSQ